MDFLQKSSCGCADGLSSGFSLWQAEKVDVFTDVFGRLTANPRFFSSSLIADILRHLSDICPTIARQFYDFSRHPPTFSDVFRHRTTRYDTLRRATKSSDYLRHSSDKAPTLYDTEIP
jgi:hypothetical protein